MILRIIATVIGVALVVGCLAVLNPWLIGVPVGAVLVAWGLLSDSEAP